jgi:hypothetical protein
MSINMSNDKMIPKNVPTDADARDATVASQEERYLEKTEEKLRAILISEDPSTYVQQETACVDCCFVTDLDEELDHAAEELITGDSDDPPLSEENVVEILRMTSNARRLDV